MKHELKKPEKPDLDELAAERQRLRRVIAEDRAELAEAAQRLRRPLKVIGEVERTVSFARGHPALLLIPIAVLVVLKPQRSIRLLASLVGLWRGYKIASGQSELRFLDVMGAVMPPSVSPSGVSLRGRRGRTFASLP